MGYRNGMVMQLLSRSTQSLPVTGRNPSPTTSGTFADHVCKQSCRAQPEGLSRPNNLDGFPIQMGWIRFASTSGRTWDSPSSQRWRSTLQSTSNSRRDVDTSPWTTTSRGRQSCTQGHVRPWEDCRSGTTKFRSTRFNYLNTTSTTAIDSGADQQPGAAGTGWHWLRALRVPRSREWAKPRQWWLGRLVAARSSPTLEAISGLVGMEWPLESVDEHCLGGSIQPVRSRWSCSSTRFCARLAPSPGLWTWDLGTEQHPLCPERELFSQQGGAGVAQPVARWWHQETRWRWTFRSVVCGLWGRRLHGRHGGTIWKSWLGISDHGWSLWGWVCHPGGDRCISTWGPGSHRTRPPNTQRSPREATSGKNEPSVLLITALATTPTTGSTRCTRDKIYYMFEVWRSTSRWRVPQEGLQGHGDPHRRGSFCVFCRGPGSTGSMHLRRTRPSTGSYDPRSNGARQSRHRRRRSNSNLGLRGCVGKDHGDQLKHQGWDGPTSARSWTEADVRVRKLIQWPMFVNCLDEDFCWGSQWTTEDSCSWQGFRSCAFFCGDLAITRSSHRLFRGSHCL